MYRQEPNYKTMLEAVEKKLRTEMGVFKKAQDEYKEKGLRTSYIDGRFECAEITVAFIEDLRRIYAR